MLSLYYREIMTLTFAVMLTLCTMSRTSQVAAGESVETQTVSKAGAHPSVKRTETFTGDVRLDVLFLPKESSPVSGAYVTFEPGARTYWHVHPAGQHLVVTSGVGRAGTWDGPVEEIKAGDVVWCPSGVKHWHGASPTTAMTHMAITNLLDGKGVEWMEEVGSEQYNR